MITPEDLIKSCKDNWDTFKSDCSGFVKAVAAKYNVVFTGKADDILDQLADNTNWQEEVDGVAAAKAASAGKLVIAGLKSDQLDPVDTNGHVVIVVKGELVNGKYPLAYWGKLNGVGDKNKGVNYAFNKASRDNVNYYSKTLTSLLNA